MSTKEKKPSEVLREAIKLIRKHGWNQGSYCGDDGAICASNAIAIASGRDPWTMPDSGARRELHSLIKPELIATWNDRDDQTRTNVLRTMGKAARQLERRGR